MHIVVDNLMYTLAPLPMQPIIPILECIDVQKTAYFSFNNQAAKEILIPALIDRNILLPNVCYINFIRESNYFKFI